MPFLIPLIPAVAGAVAAGGTAASLGGVAAAGVAAGASKAASDADARGQAAQSAQQAKTNESTVGISGSTPQAPISGQGDTSPVKPLKLAAGGAVPFAPPPPVPNSSDPLFHAPAAQASGAQAAVNLYSNQALELAQQSLNTPQALAANDAAAQNQAFAQAAGGVNGLGNQSAVYNQLGNVASGTGPNPAQAMLAQQTGQNINAQAALAAGQRGAGANAGLLARQIGQQGAATQQNAIGQGASLQAQQSLNALGQQAGIAGQQVSQQQAALNASTAAAQANQTAALGQYGQVNTIAGNLANTSIGGTNAQALAGQNNTNSLIAGGLQGAGAAGAAYLGGSHPTLATAPVAPSAPAAAPTAIPNQSAGQFAAEGGMIGKYAQGGPISKLGQHFHSIKMAKGGKVPVLVSPGEKIIPRKDVKAVTEGKKAPMHAGKTVAGKAKVAGAKNSYANDTVPKSLNEGDIVLPRSVTQSKNPHWAAHKFVAEIMRKKGSL